MKTNFEDQHFDKLDTLLGQEYYACKFTNCDLSDANLSAVNFIECTFENCNLSNINIANAGLKTVNFISCKMMGIDFSVCSNFLLEVSFSDCQLDYSTFMEKNLKKTKFTNCSIREAFFIETNLSEASFDGCDLTNTTFDRANLTSADISRAKNYRINPNENIIKKAKFSYPEVLTLLEGYNIRIVN